MLWRRNGGRSPAVHTVSAEIKTEVNKKLGDERAATVHKNIVDVTLGIYPQISTEPNPDGHRIFIHAVKIAKINKTRCYFNTG